ncbi:hypothetical protein Fmac_022391 [Flemingia macrophylla]|uniref:F-box protein n=1 Tax=Flemingia macrophylla TaxID=520843 RepID=A0ABD1LZK6_9FABA
MMPEAEDIATEACHDVEKVAAQAMHGNRSVWMAPWMRKDDKSATPACSGLGIGGEVKEEKEESGAEPRDLLGWLDGTSRHAEAVGEAARAKSVTFTDEADVVKSKKASNGSKSFPAFKVSQKLDGKSETEVFSGDVNVSLSRAGTSRAGLPSTSASAPAPAPAHALSRIQTPVTECRVLSQEVLPTAPLTKSPLDVEQKNLAVSTSLSNDFVKSASDTVPDERGKGKNVMPQFMHEPSEICQSSYNLSSQGRLTLTKCHAYSSLLIGERKMSSLLDPQRSFSSWMQGGIAHLSHDFMAGSDDGLYFVRGQHHEIEKYVVNPNITGQTVSPESTKPQIFYGLNSVVDQVPCSVHDMGSTKIYNRIDSVEELSRDRPKISQTTQHFLMSKKTDVNLSDRGQFFREPIASIKFKGNALNEIDDVSPPTSHHAQEGLKLKALGSSIKSERNENVQDFKSPTCLKNESSAETDTMDIDVLHKNNLPGDVPLQANKCSKDSQNLLTSQVPATCAREKTILKSAKPVLPDINQEPHELLAEESPVVDGETSTSRTHSLDLDHFLSHARSNSGSSSLGSDPSSRWVKRLKLCTLGSAHGTESTKIGETSLHEKVNNIFGKIMKDRKTSLVPELPAKVLTNGKSSFTEAKKTVEITLSDPWIQRWSHNGVAPSQKRQELGELHEPKSSNAVLEEFQKKQFPSIAAMALMGKAMNSLNPSELTKKGPVIVWNMKGF